MNETTTPNEGGTMTEDQIRGRLNELVSACKLQGAMMVDKTVDQNTKDELRAEVARLRDDLLYDLTNS
jgi:hypothetical protein